VLPVVIKLDAKSQAGGFVRNWQLPAEKSQQTWDTLINGLALQLPAF